MLGAGRIVRGRAQQTSETPRESARTIATARFFETRDEKNIFLAHRAQEMHGTSTAFQQPAA
jgi:hypothetical protein